MALSTQARSLELVPAIAAATYSDGDVLWNPTEITEAVFQLGRIAQLFGVSGVIGDNVAAAFDLMFFQSEVDLGTPGDAVTATTPDLLAAIPLGVVSIVAGDWAVLKPATSKILTHDAKGALLLQADEASRSIFVGGVARAAMTLTEDSLALRLGVKWW